MFVINDDDAMRASGTATYDECHVWTTDGGPRATIVLPLKTAFRRTTCGGGSKCSSAWRSLSNYEEMKMSQPEHFEMLVLGSGEGGKFLAWHMAKSGRRTAVVERKLIGGSCPNTNCLPSKNEIWSAKVADLVHHADRFGIVTGSTATDMKRVLARKRDMVDGLIAMHLDRYKASGAELIMGSGRFIASKTIEVKLNDGGTRVLTGDRVALNLGTHATIPDTPGLAAAAPLTNVETLELDRLPDHLIVIGGGYVGLELAQAYRRFGSRVSIIEVGPQLAGREDSDVATAILEMLRHEAIVVHLEAKVLGVPGRFGTTLSIQMSKHSAAQT